MTDIICTFCTGRTGTGYLSQAFGTEEYGKKTIHINKDSMIAHEPWSDLKLEVQEIKANGYTDKVTIACKSRLEKIEETGINKMFVTDHRIGRFFIKPYLDLGVSVKVIRIRRDREATIESFENRIIKTKANISGDKFDKFYEEIWTGSFYHPLDFCIADGIVTKEWGRYSLSRQLGWYIDETNRQWDIIKDLLSDTQILEVDFESLFEKHTINKMSDFIGIDYNQKFISDRVNK